MTEQDLTWARFVRDMGRERRLAGFKLREVGVVSEGQVSKMESGKANFTRAVVDRYVELSGNVKLRADFDDLESHGERLTVESGPDPEFPPLYKVTTIIDAADTIDVGETIKHFEQRTVLPTVVPVTNARYGLHFEPVDGQVPKLQPIRGYHVEVVRQQWATPTNLLVDIEFPEDALTSTTTPYEFTLNYEFDRLTPLIGMVPGKPVRHYEVTARFAVPQDVEVFLIENAPPPMALDWAQAIWNGQTPHLEPIPLNKFGEVRREFYNLQPAQLYGLTWRRIPRKKLS